MRPIWLYFGLLTLIDCLNLTEMSGEFFDLSLFQNIFLLWFLLNHERKDTLVLEKGMFCFALGSFAMALLNSAGIGTDYVLNRVMIFGDNPNIIGLRMSVSMSILVLTIVQNKLKFGKLRYLLIVPLPLMLKLLIETASRVALISFILTFLVGVVLFKTKRVMGKIAVLILGAVLSIYGWLALQESELIVKRLLETYYKGDLAGRDIFWETLLPLIESNPLFGVGKIGYEAFCQRAIGFLFSPHNVFLEVLCYTGFVGLSLYVTFLYQVSKRGYESYKTEGLLLPLLLLIPVAGMILSGQILTTKIGWCIFAYVSATPLLKPKSELAGGVDMVKKHDDSL